MAYKHRVNADHYREVERVRQKRRRHDLRDFLLEVKSAGCSLCDEKHPACIQFHHRDPSNKVDRVNRLLAQSKSLKLVKEEIEKCDLLCANCHAKLHWNEIH